MASSSPQMLPKKELNRLLEEEAQLVAPKDTIIELKESAKRKFGLPPGLAAWDDRTRLVPKDPGIVPGFRGPACEFRQGMMFLCPCGKVAAPNHFSSCVVTKIDGGYARVVVQRAADMQQALIEAGYPITCVPSLQRPPRLPHPLLGALSSKYTTESQMIRWVLEEEDRVARNEFGDYEAYCRTPQGQDVVIGSQRRKILKGGSHPPLSQLPWQTPLMMLYDAEQRRRKLPASKRGQDATFTAFVAQKWKVILQRYYQSAAAQASEAALKAREDTTPGGRAKMPDFTALLGVQASPESQEEEQSSGLESESEKDTVPSPPQPPPKGKAARASQPKKGSSNIKKPPPKKARR